MARATTVQTIRHATRVATALAVGAAAFIPAASANGQCPWATSAHGRYGLTGADREYSLRSALFTFADSELPASPPAVAADPHWARLSGVLGLRAPGVRL